MPNRDDPFSRPMTIFMSSLPPNATEASRVRLELARDLVWSCPPDLGGEIAVTGSVSRGIADDRSDIELSFWADAMPADAVCRSWLRSVGAADFSPGSLVESTDDSRWITCRYRDVWVEVGWNLIEPFERLLGRIVSGEVTSHECLALARMVQDAIPLRTSSLLARWKATVLTYPDSLTERLVRDNTEVWSDPHAPLVRWALLARNQRYALAMRLSWDVQNILRILWAINRQWDGDWKWTDERSLDLLVKPARLSERINDVFSLVDGAVAIRTCFTLIEETLLLVPDEYDVSAALTSIRGTLTAGPD